MKWAANEYEWVWMSMNELEKSIEVLERMLAYLGENRPGLSLDNLRLAISLLKKSNAKPSVTDKTKKL